MEVNVSEALRYLGAGDRAPEELRLAMEEIARRLTARLTPSCSYIVSISILRFLFSRNVVCRMAGFRYQRISEYGNPFRNDTFLHNIYLYILYFFLSFFGKEI